MPADIAGVDERPAGHLVLRVGKRGQPCIGFAHALIGGKTGGIIACVPEVEHRFFKLVQQLSIRSKRPVRDIGD